MKKGIDVTGFINKIRPYELTAMNLSQKAFVSYSLVTKSNTGENTLPVEATKILITLIENQIKNLSEYTLELKNKIKE